MTDELSREQQGDLSELAGKKIVFCKRWNSRLLELGGTCSDDDAALIFSDASAEFDRQAKELIGLFEIGTGQEMLEALQRDTMTVLGTDHQYTEAAVHMYRETLAAIFDVEPWATQDNGDD